MSKQYKNDVTVWSPEGRLHQVDFAMKSLQLSPATVGLKSRNLAVLVAISPSVTALSLSPNKLIKLNDEMGLSFAGHKGHAHQIVEYLKKECLDRDFTHHDQLPVGRLVNKLCLNMQATTQHTSKKPQGVGLIIAACDNNQPYIYQVMPAGQCFNSKAMAIGANSKMACAYLKRNINYFWSATREQLIYHGIRAVYRTVASEEIIKFNSGNVTNVSVAVVGKDQPFEIVADRETSEYLRKIRSEQQDSVVANDQADSDDDDVGDNDDNEYM